MNVLSKDKLIYFNDQNTFKENYMTFQRLISKTVFLAIAIMIFSVAVPAYADSHIPDDARDSYERAVRDLERERFSSAERHLKNAIEAYPDYFDALKDLGKLNAMVFFGAFQRNPEYAGEEGAKAIEYLKKAAELSDEDHEVYVFLSQLYTLGELENLQLAKEYVMQALAIEKNDPMVYEYALSLMDPLTDMGYLMSIYKDLCKLEPESLDNLVQYFSIAQALSDMGEMIWALERIIEITDENIDDMRNLAVLYIQNREKEKALEFFPRLKEIGENNPDILNVIAQGYIQFKEFDKALESIKVLYEMNPDDYNNIYAYGYILENLNRKEEAIEKYKVLAEAPKGTMNKDNAIRSLINIHLDKENYQKVHDYCNLFIEEFPNDRLIRDVKKFRVSSLIYLYLEKEDFENVLKYAQEFIDEYPNDSLTPEIKEIKAEVEAAL